MVFGNMAERYELASMKSAGVSLIRIMRGGIMLAVMTALLSIVASSYLVPRANFEFNRRLKAIRKSKPSLVIEQGVFNKDFRGYAIRVDSKDPNGKDIKDVMVYDHTANDKSLVNATYAEKGEMYVSEDGNLFVMNLINGTQYHELKREMRDKNSTKYPFMRTEFGEWQKIFDMSEFGLELSDDNMGRNRHDLLSSFQLVEGVDSLSRLLQLEHDTNAKRFQVIYTGDDSILKEETKEEKPDHDLKEKKESNQKEEVKDSVKAKVDNDKKIPATKTTSSVKVNPSKQSLKNKVKGLKNNIKKLDKKTREAMRKRGRNKLKLKRAEGVDLASANSFAETIDSIQLGIIYQQAYTKAKGVRDQLQSSASTQYKLKKQRKSFTFKLHQHFAVSLVCILFLFIGAPLGSIVRKGGYGFPLLAAIVFYMIFMMSAIMSQKLVRSPDADPIFLAWLPCIILFPISIFLTILAAKDRKMSIPKIKLFGKKKAS